MRLALLFVNTGSSVMPPEAVSLLEPPTPSERKPGEGTRSCLRVSVLLDSHGGGRPVAEKSNHLFNKKTYRPGGLRSALE